MNILYMDHHAGEERYGGDRRAYDLAREWQKAGDEVTIVTARHCPGPGHLSPRGDFMERETEGVRFFYLGSEPEQDRVGSVRRCITDFVQKLHRIRPVLAERCHPDIIIAASCYPYDFFAAKQLAGKTGAKTVFELKEIWPRLQEELYPEGDSRLVRFLGERAMDYALKNADLVASLLPGGQRYLEERGVVPKSFEELPAGAPPLSAAKPLEGAAAEQFEAFRAEHRFVIAYTGKLSERGCPEELLRAVIPLASEGVGAVIAGNGGRKLMLRRMVREWNAGNILLLDAQKASRMETVLQASDALFYADTRRVSGEYGAYRPRLLQVMQEEKPMLLLMQGEQHPAVGFGAALMADHPRELPGLIRKLAGLSPTERRGMGKCAGDFVRREHSPARAAKSYREALTGL